MKEYLDLASDFISKVGFPIFVCLILLWRDDKRHSENVSHLQEISSAIKDTHLAVHCRDAARKMRRRPRVRKGAK